MAQVARRFAKGGAGRERGRPTEVEYVSLQEQRARDEQHTRLVRVLENARRKKVSKIKDDRARYQLVKELARRRKNYMKSVYGKSIEKTIASALRLFPEMLLEKANRRLGLLSTQKNLVQQVKDRVIILPSLDYVHLDSLFEIKTNGLFTKGLMFVDEKILRKKGVLGLVGHEIVHFIEDTSGVRRGELESEVLPEAANLYILSCASKRQRERAIRTANTKYVNKKETEEYNAGRNRGYFVFLRADEIRTAKGEKAAEFFFKSLFFLEEFTVRNIKQVYDKAMAIGN